MDAELKPCPICNSKAELKEAHYLESELPYSYVHCTNEACTLNHNAAHFSSANPKPKMTRMRLQPGTNGSKFPLITNEHLTCP